MMICDGRDDQQQNLYASSDPESTMVSKVQNDLFKEILLHQTLSNLTFKNPWMTKKFEDEY